MRSNLRQLLILILLLSSLSGFATQMDVQTHDLLIEKLERAVPQLKGLANEGSVRLRLADLYADRARLKDLEESEFNCENCMKADQDRARAINYYQTALPLVRSELQAKALLQMAHMYSLRGESQKARAVLEGILKQPKNYSREVLRETHIALGEHMYLSGQYSQAEKHFKSAIQLGARSQFINYRLAWCRINSGDVASAKKLMLTVVRESQGTEMSLKKDAARDLATILSREKVDHKKVEEFLSYSDDSDRQDNLFYLGEECDRLDNSACSQIVWPLLLADENLEKERALEIKFRMAQNALQSGRYDAALTHYKSALKGLSAKKCANQDFCKELQPRIKNFVTTWLKKEKAKPTQQLHNALLTYLDFDSTDYEMHLWAGHVARELKSNRQAVQSYSQAADSLIGAEARRAHTDQRLYKILSSALLLEIECAEVLQDEALMEQSYLHYIKLNPKGRELSRVQDQYAFLLRKQAVDFAILKYANGRGDDSDLKEALNKLNKAPMRGATHEEKVKIYHNQIQIAEKLKDIEAVDQAAINLLSIPSLSPAQKEFALERRLWVAESQLDFMRALTLFKKMQSARMSRHERQLKIAVLTELAGLNSNAEYFKYLKMNPPTESANAVRLQLIKNSRTPWSELERNQPQLRKTPAIYAEALVNVYARQPLTKKLEVHLVSRELRNQKEAQRLRLFVDLEKQQATFKSLKRHKLYANSEKQLQQRIRERIQLLRQANQAIDRAQKSGSFTVHSLALSNAAIENQRFADDLLKSRRPRGLSKTDLQIYNLEISKRADEYKNISLSITKLNENNFDKSKYYSNLIETAEDGVGVYRRLAGLELQYLIGAAPTSEQRTIQAAIRDSNQKPSSREFETARKALRNDPFDIDRIQKMKQVADQAESTTMVAFLEARLNQLMRGGS